MACGFFRPMPEATATPSPTETPMPSPTATTEPTATPQSLNPGEYLVILGGTTFVVPQSDEMAVFIVGCTTQDEKAECVASLFQEYPNFEKISGLETTEGIEFSLETPGLAMMTFFDTGEVVSTPALVMHSSEGTTIVEISEMEILNYFIVMPPLYPQ